jgi:hypothetical protein
VLYLGYCSYAAGKNEDALGRSDFEMLWSVFCKETKLEMRRHGTKTIIEDVKLVA